jgi:hypothetical protein
MLETGSLPNFLLFAGGLCCAFAGGGAAGHVVGLYQAGELAPEADLWIFGVGMLGWLGSIAACRYAGRVGRKVPEAVAE